MRASSITAGLRHAILNLLLQSSGDFVDVAAGGRSRHPGRRSVVAGEISQCRLALHVDEILHVVHLEDRLGRVHHCQTMMAAISIGVPSFVIYFARHPSSGSTLNDLALSVLYLGISSGRSRRSALQRHASAR